jgi:hypothetical protein
MGSLLPGQYTVRAELSGFRTQNFTDVRLGSGTTVRVNFSLEVGGVADSIEVTTSAAQLLLEASPSVGGVLERAQIEILPVISGQGAEAIDLVRTLPGVQMTSDPIAGGDDTTLAGVSAAFAQVQRDGVDASGGGRWATGLVGATVVNPDLVGEVKATLAPVDAAVGRGNALISMRTRSGSNEFHGAGVWRASNSALEPNSWSNNRAQPQAIAPLWYNDHQFTASLGGPIKKDRTHFFVLWDHLIPNSRTTINNQVLTPCAQRGIFRFYDDWNNGNAEQILTGGATPTIAVVDHLGNPKAPVTTPTGAPHNGALRYASVFGRLQNVPTRPDCSDAVVTGASWDPFRTQMDRTGYIGRVFEVMPAANNYDIGDGLNSAGYRFIRGQQGITGRFGHFSANLRKQINLRLDHRLNSVHTVGGTYTYERNTSSYSLPLWGPPGESGFPGGAYRRPQVLAVNLTSTLSPTMLNEIRVGMRRTGTNSFHAFSQRADPAYREAALEWYPSIASMPVFLQPGENAIGCCTGGQPGGHSATGGAFHADVADNTRAYTLADTFSWTRGRHAFQVGGEVRHSRTSLAIDVVGNDWSTYPRAFGGETTLTPVQGITSANIPGLAGTTTTGNNQRMRALLNLLSGSLSRVTQLYWLGSSDTVNKWNDYRDSNWREREMRQNELSIFLKDDWQATRNLTLNLGARWDYYGVPWVTEGLTPVLVGGGNALFGYSGRGFGDWMAPGKRGEDTQLVLGGPGSASPDLRPFSKQFTNFGPALGFAWQVPWFGAGQTTVRGGYQLTYLSERLGGHETALANPPGTSWQSIFDGGPGLEYFDLARLTQIIPNAPPVLPMASIPVTARNVNLTAYDPSYRAPYVQNLTLAITRNVGRNLVADVRYVGTLSRKLNETINLNSPNFIYNGLKEAFDSARSGGESALLDQMFRGMNIAGAGFGAVGTTFNGVLQTGAMHLRAAAAGNLRVNLANGNYSLVADTLNTLNYSTAVNAGLPAIPAGVNGAVLRYNGFPENFIKANPQLGNANLLTNAGNSNYHSLQTQLTLRPIAGISLQGSYTWSKSLGRTGPFTDPVNRSGDYTIQDGNRTHDFRMNGTFALPFGPGKLALGNSSGWVSRVVEGWTVGWFYSAASGAVADIVAQNMLYANGVPDIVGPFDPAAVRVQWQEGAANGTYLGSYSQVRDPQCNALTTLQGLRDRCTLNAVADGSGNIVLQHPQPGKAGTLGRGILENPGDWSLDMTLAKRVRVSEKTSLQFRVETLNVFNHPTPSNPVLDINNGNFNRILTKGALLPGGATQFAGDGKRLIKLNLRVEF